MIKEIQNGFYNQLKTWETYATSSGVTYNTFAPQTASFPYVTFGLLTERPIGEFGDFECMEDLTFWVNCFSSVSMAHISEMADNVTNSLDDSVLTVSGYTSMKCVREYTGQPMYDTEQGIYQIPLRFRVWLDKS
jgi:hypothetical protein